MIVEKLAERLKVHEPRRAYAPDRIDLDAHNIFGPLFVDNLKGIVAHAIGSPRPGRLAPMPSGGEPVLGHLREGINDPLRSFTKWRAECGDVLRFRLGTVEVHLVSDPVLIREMFQERHREFVKPIQGRLNLAQILGNGLLVSEGDFWLRQRRIAQPAFHRRHIAGFANRMVEAAEDLGDEWARRAETREHFDVARDMMRITLRIVQETLLGVQSAGDADEIGESLSYLLSAMNERFLRPVRPPDRWPGPKNRRFQRHSARLDEAVRRIIRERRAAGGVGEDLVSMLLSAVDEDTGESMDDRQLRDEVMTMFLAGHETTANALSWTFYLLGRHPEVARRLRAELEEVLEGRAPTADDYPALVYTRMVFQEAMRLYPPAWITARAPRESTELGGYRIEAGTRIFVSPFVMHRHPDHWSDPEGFDPERFRDPKAIDPFVYFPFGGGRRFCIGQGFAMMEGVLLIATLARRFRLELVPGRRVELEPLVTLRPRGGVLVKALAL